MTSGTSNPFEQLELDALKAATDELQQRGSITGGTFAKLDRPWQVTIRQDFPDLIDGDELDWRWKPDTPGKPWDENPEPFPAPWNHGFPPAKPDPAPFPPPWEGPSAPKPWDPLFPESSPPWKPEMPERKPWDLPDPDPFPRPGS